MTRAVAAVLAAGSGVRFGATKQLAELEGRSLVAHDVGTAVAAGCAPVLLVVGHDADAVAAAVDDDVVRVDNPTHEHGQATSLRRAVLAAGRTDADVLVVLLADEPQVSVEAVRDVLTSHAAGARVARARYDDRPGHPIAFDREVWPRLLDVSGDTGARQLLTDLEVTPVRIAGPAPVDVDTPSDLEGLA